MWFLCSFAKVEPWRLQLRIHHLAALFFTVFIRHTNLSALLTILRCCRVGTAPLAELTPPRPTQLREPKVASSPSKTGRPRAAREREEAVRQAMKKLLITDRRGFCIERCLQWLAFASDQGHSVARRKLDHVVGTLGSLLGYAYPVHDITDIQLQNPSIGCPPTSKEAVRMVPIRRRSSGSALASAAIADDDATDTVERSEGGVVSFKLPPISPVCTPGRESAALVAVTPLLPPPVERPWTPKALHTLKEKPSASAPSELASRRQRITIQLGE